MIYKNVLILGGKTGLLGQALSKACQETGIKPISPGREELDIFDQQQILNIVQKNDIQAIFNTVAYTQVDLAEEQEQEASRLNKTLPQMLGQVAKKENLALIHYSTDFVFDGRKHTPYTPEDTPDPCSVYGNTKLAGEQELLKLELKKLLIIRTSWLFGPGKTNFVHKIMNFARQREEIRVVHDQVGSPTYTPDLACHSLELLNAQATGIYHLTNSGQASWCELATEAVHSAGIHCQIRAISSEEFPQKAKRPPYSVLDCNKFTKTTGTKPRPWIRALRDYIFQEPSSCQQF